MGVLVGKGGFYGNVFRITPPLCFTKEDSGKICISAEESIMDEPVVRDCATE
jgi:alanine-glyoxylate transaminase/(R)-3-amino-2-methylpropionate-pyruvate transaminase